MIRIHFLSHYQQKIMRSFFEKRSYFCIAMMENRFGFANCTGAKNTNTFIKGKCILQWCSNCFKPFFVSILVNKICLKQNRQLLPSRQNCFWRNNLILLNQYSFENEVGWKAQKTTQKLLDKFQWRMQTETREVAILKSQDFLPGGPATAGNLCLFCG